MTGIYKITINDYYIYIGQSVDIENRWRQHLTTLQNHKHSNYKLQNIYDKFSDKIKFETIEECDESELNDKEVFYIEQFNTFNSDYGLNLCLGGNSHRKYKTQEERNSVSYKHIAILGLRNNNPKLPTGNYYQYIFVTRNLAVAKNSLHSRYPNHTTSVLLELPSILSDSELNQMRIREEKANYIIRNKQRQTKFEIKQTQLQQFYYSDKAEFTKYLNNLKTRIECDWENNKFYLNKKIGGIWTHSNKDEISFKKLTEICIEQERKKLVIINNNDNEQVIKLKQEIKQLQNKIKKLQNKNK